MITFEDVTKKYPDGTVAVDDLTLEVPEGTLAVFVGPSGCGKTTSMRMINRMIDPTSGTLTVDGKDVTKVDAGQAAARHRLRHPERRSDAASAGRRQRRDRAGAARANPGAAHGKPRSACWSGSAWIPKLADRYPAQLSGGQQQRVGVARALAADPPILLMDEPFSAVDPVVREDLQTEILRLQSELRKTIVFVTHDIDEAIKLGEKVAVFGRGGVLQQYDAPRAAAVQPGQRLRRRLHRRRPRLPRAAVLPRDRACRCTTSGTSREAEHRRAGHSARASGRWSPSPTARRMRGSTPTASSCTAREARCTTARPPAVRCSGRTARCGWRSTRRCPRPSGLGVAVDDDGQVIGGVKADDVLAALDEQRARQAGVGPMRYLLTHLDDAVGR